MGTLAGKRFRIRVLGCRTNQYEAEAIASQLILRGAVPSAGVWDVAVLLSCPGTSEADRTCRQQVRRLRRENPGGVIIATGCWAQEVDPSEARHLGLDAVVGNRLKWSVPDTAEFLLQGRAGGPVPLVSRLPSPPQEAWDGLQLDRPVLHTRAFLKVQDGCDHFCSYCIVPYVRGKPVSRDPGDILDEARRVAISGCHEIVLTGVHLGLYGGQDGWSLARLVEAISKVEGIERIRFGSIEPFALDEGLVKALAGIPSFCPHLHVPLQSGDDGVLMAMRRGYDSGGFARIIERVRSLWSEDVHFSTDLMIGFPGESDKAFRNTLSLVKNLGFGKLHVFPYSARPKTLAASLEGQVPESVKKDRCEEGITLGDGLLSRFAMKFLGSEVPVLVENRRKDELKGLTPHFLSVRWKGEGVAGKVKHVLVSRFENGEFQG